MVVIKKKISDLVPCALARCYTPNEPAFALPIPVEALRWCLRIQVPFQRWLCRVIFVLLLFAAELRLKVKTKQKNSWSPIEGAGERTDSLRMEHLAYA